jgi:hypothetical protein
VAEWAAKNGASWTVLRPHMVMGPSLNSPMNLVTSLAIYTAMNRELLLPLRFPGTKEGWNTLQDGLEDSWWSLGSDDMPSSSESIPPQHVLPQGRAST